MLLLGEVSILLVLSVGLSAAKSVGSQDASQLQCERFDATCKFSTLYESDTKPLVVNALEHSIKNLGDKEEYTLYKDNYIYLQCLGKNNSFAHTSEHAFLKGKSFTKSSCVCGQTFESECKTYNLNNLQCEQPHQVDIVESKIKSIYKNNHSFERWLKNAFHRYEIGATIADTFTPYLEILYHSDTCSIIYSRTSTKKNVSLDINVSMDSAAKRNDFACPNLKYDLHYDENSQVQSLAYQNITDVVKPGTGYIFVPVYLTPPDFMPYVLGRFMSNFQINIAPQWKIISEGNWAVTNDFVYDFMSLRNATAITGVYGSLQLKNSTGRKSDPLSLYQDDKGKQEIYIPLYFIKMVYTENYDQGSVFVTVNNPYVTSETEKKFTDEICGNVFYAKIKPAWDLEHTGEPDYFYPKGYSFYCYINDFVTKTDFPYEDEKLLTVKSTIPVMK